MLGKIVILFFVGSALSLPLNDQVSLPTHDVVKETMQIPVMVITMPEEALMVKTETSTVLMPSEVKEEKVDEIKSEVLKPVETVVMKLDQPEQKEEMVILEEVKPVEQKQELPKEVVVKNEEVKTLISEQSVDMPTLTIIKEVIPEMLKVSAITEKVQETPQITAAEQKETISPNEVKQIVNVEVVVVRKELPMTVSLKSDESSMNVDSRTDVVVAPVTNTQMTEEAMTEQNQKREVPQVVEVAPTTVVSDVVEESGNTLKKSEAVDEVMNTEATGWNWHRPRYVYRKYYPVYYKSYYPRAHYRHW